MQLKIWKQFIGWEKRNPTRTESNALLVKRGQFMYKKIMLTGDQRNIMV